MKEIVDLIEYLARRVGELNVANIELREENAKLLREIERMRPYVKAYADAKATVAKK